MSNGTPNNEKENQAPKLFNDLNTSESPSQLDVEPEARVTLKKNSMRGRAGSALKTATKTVLQSPSKIKTRVLQTPSKMKRVGKTLFQSPTKSMTPVIPFEEKLCKSEIVKSILGDESKQLNDALGEVAAPKLEEQQDKLESIDSVTKVNTVD